MKIIKAFTILLLLVPIIALGQTLNDKVEYTPPYRDLRSFDCQRTAQYYGEINHPTYHGMMHLKGSDNLKGGYRNDQQQYEETRNYQHGILNGKISQSYNHSGNGSYGGHYTISHRWTMQGNFENGVPHGTWTFNLNSHFANSSERDNTVRNETATYNHGKLTSLTDRNGQRITFDEEGLISGIGQLKDGKKVTLQHSIINNTYRNKTGDMLKTGAKEKEIINELVAQHNHYDIFALTDRGYAIDWQEAFISQFTRYAEHLDRYAQIDKIAPNFPMPTYSIRVGYLQEIQKVSDDEAVEYYIQRQEEFSELMRNGYFIKWQTKRYFGTSAAEKIKAMWLENQKEVLIRKFNLITNLTAESRWNEILTECRKGENALPDLFAWKWSNKNLSKKEAYNEVANLIDSKLKSLHPIVGIEVMKTEFTPDATMKALCIIHKGNLDSVGYQSIQAEISTNLDGYILLDRLQPETYQRINNTWDTIYALEDSIRHQHLEVRKLLYSAQYLDFKSYCESVLADKSNMPEVRLADLRELQQLQKETAYNAPLLKEIAHKNSSIEARLHQFKYILKLYHTYYENVDPTWDSHIEDLQELLKNQQRILKTKKKSSLPKIERSLKRAQATSINQLLEQL